MFEDSCHGNRRIGGWASEDRDSTTNLGLRSLALDIPLAALANNILNVRLKLSLALDNLELPRLELHLRENFIDAVDITRIACE
jgi:hypothetical protein